MDNRASRDTAREMMWIRVRNELAFHEQRARGSLTPDEIAAHEARAAAAATAAQAEQQREIERVRAAVAAMKIRIQGLRGG
jgi:hypothetical protein